MVPLTVLVTATDTTCPLVLVTFNCNQLPNCGVFVTRYARIPKALESRNAPPFTPTNVVNALALPTELDAVIGTCGPTFVRSNDCNSIRSPCAKARTLVLLVFDDWLSTEARPAATLLIVSPAPTV